jgi:hypothetical protein
MRTHCENRQVLAVPGDYGIRLLANLRNRDVIGAAENAEDP